MLKGAGAATFLADYYLRGSPASFLLFAASDGLIAAVTLYALLQRPRVPAAPERRHARRKPRIVWRREART